MPPPHWDPLLYTHLSNTDTTLCPFYVRFKEVRLFFEKKKKIYKECMSSLTFCHPVILHFLFLLLFSLLLIAKSWILHKLHIK